MIKEMDSIELASRLEAGEEIKVVDIRNHAELMHGVLPEAEHLPMHLIPLKINDLPKDKDVVLYCRSGARSYQATAYLAQQGFANVYNLRGGIIHWVRSGFEIDAPTPA